jgi:EAL domain-containing protein (putative c-di-GMP-specific phosphodiesterase class I)
MGKIDRWVVRQTLQAMANSGLRNGEVKFAINISALSLMDEGLAVYLREQLCALRISPAALCLEITETAVIAHLATALTFIHDLKALGCTFALDDFGAGMSSFAYLKNLPVDYLKIDGTFVRDIVIDPIDRTFVEAINRIGQVMGKKTIAEFAENENIIEMLANMGVDFAQGYGVSRPLPLEDWLSRLAMDNLKPEAA